MRAQKITYSKWVAWDNRANISGIDSPGVYLLSRKKRTLLRHPRFSPKEIIYVGETRQTLRKRLGQFDRSAFRGSESHSGGVTYSTKFVPSSKSRLYVSIIPIARNQLSPLFIKYIERKLIWEYAKKWVKLPKCNSI